MQSECVCHCCTVCMYYVVIAHSPVTAGMPGPTTLRNSDIIYVYTVCVFVHFSLECTYIVHDYYTIMFCFVFSVLYPGTNTKIQCIMLALFSPIPHCHCVYQYHWAEGQK